MVKSVSILLRLSEVEREAIKAAALRSGKKVSPWVRGVLLSAAANAAACKGVVGVK